jgi:hypothetical protein
MFAVMDTINEPKKIYAQAWDALDSMNCDYVMDLALYAKQFEWHTLYLRCVTRAIELGGELTDDPDYANLVFEPLKVGADSTFYWDAVDSLDGIFLRRNQGRIATMEALRTIDIRDQVRRDIYRSLPQERHRSGTDTTWTTADSIVTFIDSTNFARLIQLCKIHSELPLSDRYGYRASGIVFGLLLHNGKNRRGYNQRWRAIWPYITDAMDNCRLGMRYMHLYDRTHLLVYGKQWFGTIPDQPLEPGNVAERLAKRIIE